MFEDSRFLPLKRKECSFKISLSVSERYRVGMGGLFRWGFSYVLHTLVVPSSFGMLVHRLVTSIDIRNVSFCDLRFLYKV